MRGCGGTVTGRGLKTGRILSFWAKPGPFLFLHPFNYFIMKLWQILVHAAVNVILQLVDKKRDRAGK